MLYVFCIPYILMCFHFIWLKYLVYAYSVYYVSFLSPVAHFKSFSLDFSNFIMIVVLLWFCLFCLGFIGLFGFMDLQFLSNLGRFWPLFLQMCTLLHYFFLRTPCPRGHWGSIQASHPHPFVWIVSIALYFKFTHLL